MKQTLLHYAFVDSSLAYPGNDINFYLPRLIDELKELWTIGVNMSGTYTGTTFCTRAALLWTIGDFPTNVILPGWSREGLIARSYCPSSCLL